ncbi:MAG: pyridoxal 5'-phosphate synthase glutaminase subunit PdxT [Dehalococcoidales bacterium]|nr:pyridoxal 5'-phosphate synthase glutaminase subunit PdxT [Dehalococcoidales bacterium]
MKIGVLALQGAFAEHIATLDRLGVEAREVRLPRELNGIDGLIIPGGESTSISRLMVSFKLRDNIKSLAKNGLPVLGTCAGMILLAKQISDSDAEPIGVIDIEVKRNAFGRQQESFETELFIPALGPEPFPAVFIRAPLIEKVGNGVEILARLADGTVVAAKQKNVLVAAFHPELTNDLRFHRYFLNLVSGQSKQKDRI